MEAKNNVPRESLVTEHVMYETACELPSVSSRNPCATALEQLEVSNIEYQDGKHLRDVCFDASPGNRGSRVHPAF
jgi:hypothetical protein